MTLTEAGDTGMTDMLNEGAVKHCGGRIVWLLEGRYDLQALGESVETHLLAPGA